MGAALLFTLAIGVALLVVGGRRLSAWRAARAQLARPGRSEERPIPVRDYNELETTWQRERCACGGRLELVGESTVTGRSATITVVLLRCHACGTRDTMFFDVSAIAS